MGLNSVMKEFHTRQEFILIFCMEVLYTLIFVSLLFPGFNNSEMVHTVDYICMSRSAVFMCISILWPVYTSYFGAQVPLFPNRGVVKSLDQVLSEPLALKYFHQYMQGELNYVFLLFWMDVEMFRENMDDVESMGQNQDNFVARRLFNTYFRAPRDVRDEISNSFEPNPETMRNREMMTRMMP